MCNELECRKCRANRERNLDEVFFDRKRETNMDETNAKTQKRTQENFI